MLLLPAIKKVSNFQWQQLLFVAHVVAISAVAAIIARLGLLLGQLLKHAKHKPGNGNTA